MGRSSRRLLGITLVGLFGACEGTLSGGADAGLDSGPADLQPLAADALVLDAPIAARDGPLPDGPPPGWAPMRAPPSHQLTAVWGVAEPFALFAVGQLFWEGVVLRYDGVWSSLLPPGMGVDQLRGVWGSSSKELFAVGASRRASRPTTAPGPARILHFTRGRWRAMAPPPELAREASWLNGVWGSGPGDVFAVGAQCSRPDLCRGVIVHYDGQLWEPSWLPPGRPVRDELLAVWGTGARDVYAVGQGGQILHFNGEAWTRMRSGSQQRLSGVWGSGPADVFAVGTDGTVLHFDGDAWRLMPVPGSADLRAVWGSGPTDVYAVGTEGTILRFDGASWTAMLSGTQDHLNGVWVSGAGDVYAVSEGGLVLHRRP